MDYDDIVGKTGLVTGKVGPDLLGLVSITIRGGSESYNAVLADDAEHKIIPVGTEVEITKFYPPSLVLVNRKK